MHFLSVVGGLAVGLLFGMVGVILARREASQIEGQLEGARDEIERIRKQTSGQLDQLKATQAGASKEAAQQQQQIQALQKLADDRARELESAKSGSAEIERQRDQAIEQANARQAARVQAEGRLKQAEKLASESVQKLEASEATLQAKLGELAAVAQTSERRDSEIRRLRADLTAATDGQSISDLESSIEVFSDADGSLQKILETLLEREGLRAAVLADNNGIVIASAGEKDLRDGMAATAQLFSTVGTRFEGMVPFGAIRAFSVSDSEAIAIAGRTFDAAGEMVALATYGHRMPNDRVLDGASASLNAALE